MSVNPPVRERLAHRLKSLTAFSLLLVVTLLTVLPTASTATTIVAASCSTTDVQAAINSATTGDRVVVPAGNCSWAAPVRFLGTSLVLQGAGRDATIIEVTIGNALQLGTTASRVTGFGFIFTGSADRLISARGQGFRIDANRFTNHLSQFRVAIHVAGDGSAIPHPTGVIYDNEFIDSRVLVLGDVSLLAHHLWREPLRLGNASDQTGVVYVEDNNFTHSVHGNSIDSNYGGRYVFRHNQVIHSLAEAHSVQGNHRASRSWEIYNNSFHTSSALFTAMFLRGGTGVAFNNVITGGYGTGIRLDNVRSFSDRSYPPGRCDGSSPWDGNQDAGWPCRDQIGRSTDAPGDFPQPQASAPAYFWNNTLNGKPSAPVVANCGSIIKPEGSCSDIRPGRDYIVGIPKPAYEPFPYPHPLRQHSLNPPTGIRLH